MKLQKYDLRLNKERNKSVLVKECCFSYPGYSLNNPEKIVAALNTVEDMIWNIFRKNICICLLLTAS